MEILSNPAFLTTKQSADLVHKNAMQEKAQELEGVFLNTLMSQMFSSLETDSLFGGGHAEETWRSMQSEQYADILAQNGGVGMADQIMANLLDIQENAKATSTYYPSSQLTNINNYQSNKEAQ